MTQTQQQTKYCSGCLNDKPISDFSKCKSNQDGLQYKCKSCNKVTNKHFREIINPLHHRNWQQDNPKRIIELVHKYRKADKMPIIYSITSPTGFQYIGQTMMHLVVRKIEHVSHYKRYLKGARIKLELLHNSFTMHGLENHKFALVNEYPGVTRKELIRIEKAYITINKSKNISLNK